MPWKLYHNPLCSKSREALALLRESAQPFVVVEYLSEPPSVEALKEILDKLEGPLHEIVRTKEAAYTGFPLDDKATIASEIARQPILLERPLLVMADKAIVGRPVEKIIALLEEIKSAD